MFGKRSCCRSPLAAAICGFFTTVCAKESAEELEVENSWDGNVEPVWGGGIGGSKELQSQGKSGYRDVPIKQEWTIPLSVPI